MRTASFLCATVLAFGLASCDDDDDEDTEQCPDDDHGRAGDVPRAPTDSLAARPRVTAHDHDEDPCSTTEFGPPTESLCPDNSTLTWESFGQSFMSSYCTRCHSSELTGDARQGAPLYHDFDTLMGVLVVADHVDRKAAAGPAATNTLMPISAPLPTDDERKQLGEWLACELDKM